MSLYDYKAAVELVGKDTPFYALIMAAMLKADDKNIHKLRLMWPDVWNELRRRYHNSGGILEEE